MKRRIFFFFVLLIAAGFFFLSKQKSRAEQKKIVAADGFKTGALKSVPQLFSSRFSEYVFHDRFGDTIIVRDFHPGNEPRFLVIAGSVFNEVDGDDSLMDDRGKCLRNIHYEFVNLIQSFSDSARKNPLLLHLYWFDELDNVITDTMSLAGCERVLLDTTDWRIHNFQVQEMQLDNDSDLERIVETNYGVGWMHRYSIYDRKDESYELVDVMEHGNRTDFFDSVTYDQMHNIFWVKNHGWGSGFGVEHGVGLRLEDDEITAVTAPVVKSMYSFHSGVFLDSFPLSYSISAKQEPSDKNHLQFRVKASFEVYDHHLDSSLQIFSDSSLVALFEWKDDSAFFLPSNALAEFISDSSDESPEFFYREKFEWLKIHGNPIQRKYFRYYEGKN